MPKALGLVETRGLVAAIEAADAMVKAANVTLIGKERTDPALITIKVVGETAAVRSAVDAGAAAASRVGVMVSTHIIPQPDLQMISLLPEIDEGKKSAKEKTSSKEKKPGIISETEPAEEKPVEVNLRKRIDPEVKVEKPEEKKVVTTDSDTIARLRKEALGIEEEKPAASTKGKKKINLAEIEILNVHQLRRFARNTEGFPIQGREISRANRNELLDYFKDLL
jgi:ethanolamine utilization protein EutM